MIDSVFVALPTWKHARRTGSAARGGAHTPTGVCRGASRARPCPYFVLASVACGVCVVGRAACVVWRRSLCVGVTRTRHTSRTPHGSRWPMAIAMRLARASAQTTKTESINLPPLVND